MTSEPSQHLKAVLASITRLYEQGSPENLSQSDIIEAQRAYASKPQPSVNEAVAVIPITIGHCKAEWLVPPEAEQNKRILMIHGGGFYANGLNSHRNFSIQLATYSACPVLAIDYRLSPETPYPGALDDCMAAWKYMIATGPSGPAPAAQIFVMGDSAGGNLAAALLLRAHNEGLPKAHGCVLLSPALDLTCSGNSWATNVATDIFLGNPEGEVNREDDWWIDNYLDGQDPTHAYVSPLFGDLNDFPPLLTLVSQNERLLDDARRFHDKALKSGVDSSLECWDHVCHAWASFSVKVPESDRALMRMGEFIKSRN